MSVVRIAVIAAAVFASVAPAAAQYARRQASFASGQAYAIEVSPGTYVIHRPSKRGYPYVGCGADCAPAAKPHVRRHAHTHTHNDPALIEELRRKHAHGKKDKVIRTSRIVRDKPVVIEHRRVVDDPPRVINRVTVVEGPPPRASPQPRRDHITGGARRVIRAEAEVTILGPDRMSIRLIRKSGARQATSGE